MVGMSIDNEYKRRSMSTPRLTLHNACSVGRPSFDIREK